jgi:ectoine hydroxylase-related dioxygenase (phytanoyl-CoA dioxygenase family)
MDHGYWIVANVLSVAEMDALRSAVETLPRGRAGARDVLSHPDVRKVAADPRLSGLAKTFLSRPAIPFKATLFDKSADSNWLVTWHQDLALPIRRRVDAPSWGPWTEKGGRLHAIAPAAALQSVIALRVHLDDSFADNGPLRVLPGTHRLGRLQDDRIAVAARETDPVECVVHAGGVIAMRPLLLHASSKSTNAAARRVIHIEYACETVFDGGIELDVA